MSQHARYAIVAAVGIFTALVLRHRRRHRYSAAQTGVLITGSGCSAGGPMMVCALNAPSANCQACALATRGPRDPNYRGNVCATIRFRGADGAMRLVQIDCGKTWRESVLRWWPRRGFSGGLSAVLLTHDHADAVLGIDDLRALQPYDPKTRQPSASLPVLADRRSLATLKRTFPYLFAPSTAPAQSGAERPRQSAAAALPAFELSCSCCDEVEVEAQALLVAASQAAQPSSSAPRAAPRVVRFVARLDWHAFPSDGAPFDAGGLRVRALPVLHGADYVCFGFGFGEAGARVAWISDYTEILPPTAALLERWAAEPEGLALLVLDVLTVGCPTPTHADLAQSLGLVRRCARDQPEVALHQRCALVEAASTEAVRFPPWVPESALASSALASRQVPAAPHAAGGHGPRARAPRDQPEAARAAARRGARRAAGARRRLRAAAAGCR